MVFSKSVDKTLCLYLFVHGSRGHHRLLRKRRKKLRPLRDVRVPNASNPDLEKTMGKTIYLLDLERMFYYNFSYA